MKKDLELADPKSCLNKADDNELLFILLERDPAATAAVKTWIAERIRLGKNNLNDAQIIEARNWISQVEKKHDKTIDS